MRLWCILVAGIVAPLALYVFSRRARKGVVSPFRLRKRLPLPPQCIVAGCLRLVSVAPKCRLLPVSPSFPPLSGCYGAANLVCRCPYKRSFFSRPLRSDAPPTPIYVSHHCRVREFVPAPPRPTAVLCPSTGRFFPLEIPLRLSRVFCCSRRFRFSRVATVDEPTVL